jgi:adenosylmethionine-8-amino-7-oxononanoate aminotransferase
VIVLGPPFVIGDEEIERMAEVLEWAISRVVGRSP